MGKFFLCCFLVMQYFALQDAVIDNHKGVKDSRFRIYFHFILVVVLCLFIFSK